MKENLSEIQKSLNLKNKDMLLEEEKRLGSRACCILSNERSRLRKKFLNYILETFKFEE